MKRLGKAALVALSLCAVMATGAFAQKAPGPLESRLEAHKVVVVDGRESRVAASDAKPGDVIEYVAIYRNSGKNAITGLQATLPIPPETEFIPGSVVPAQAQASLDGKTFAAMPLNRTVERAGRKVAMQVPYREYRYLRWSADELGGGQATEFKARVRVSDAPPAPEPERKGGPK